MATAPLKRGDAIVWVPPRSEGERGLGSEALLLVMRAPPMGTGGYERVSLEALQGTNRVRLIFDARDVTLLTPVVPALSGSRLAQALPNVIEESLLQDGDRIEMGEVVFAYRSRWVRPASAPAEQKESDG